jgi:hypothetical protein
MTPKEIMELHAILAVMRHKAKSNRESDETQIENIIFNKGVAIGLETGAELIEAYLKEQMEKAIT